MIVSVIGLTVSAIAVILIVIGAKLWRSADYIETRRERLDHLDEY